MKAAKRRGAHFPNGMGPLSLNGSAPAAMSASMAAAGCRPSVCGIVIAKHISGV